MQDQSLHSYFKTPGLTDHDGAVGVPKSPAQAPQRLAHQSAPPRCGSVAVASRLAAGSGKPSGAVAPDERSAQRSATPQADVLRAEAHALLAHLQHTDEFACEMPTIGPAAPYLAAAKRWLAAVAALPSPIRSLLRPEQSLLSRLTL